MCRCRSYTEDRGTMNDGLACGQCGTPRMGSRCCTTCGAPLATAGVEAEFGIIPAASVVPTAPAPVDAAPMPPPWEVLSSPSPTPESAPTRVPARRTWRNVLALLVVGALGLSCWALMHGGERHVVT